MPLPKKKRSPSRGRMKAANKALKAPAVTDCSHCGQPRQPHAVCPSCGYYRGRMVVYVQK